MRVLVVDDDQKVRDLMTTVFDGAADVVTAPDGPAGLLALRDDPVDFVLLDVMMPGMSGFAVLEAIRADRVLADLPVAMLTAMAGEFEHVEAFQCGADAYLTKPFDVHELLDVVGTLVNLTPEQRSALRDEELRRAELLVAIESSFHDR